LNWVLPSFTGQTGYNLLVNGSQVATIPGSGPFIFSGLDCGTSVTLGVQAHDGSGHNGPLWTTSYTTPSCPVFPLSVAASGHSLQTASSQPFLLVADSPQSLFGDNSVTTMESFIDNRVAQGFNTLWANVLCDDYTFCNSNGQAVGDGGGAIKPFSTGTTPATYDVSTPNSAYFSRIHTVVAYARTKGIEVILDPIETGGCVAGGWMDTLVNNGDGTLSTSNKDYGYGQYLGNTFKDLDNIIWMSGNDFQCIGTTANNNDTKTVANGIHNTDPSALQTLEPDACSGFTGTACEGSSSLIAASGSATGWSSIVGVNGTYAYAPQYAEDRAAYAQTPTQPMMLLEGNYEGEKFAGVTDGCQTVRNCRLQEWWTMTSGGAGQLYGNYFTDAIGCGCTHGGGSASIPSNSFNTSDVNTTGVTQLGYQTTLLKSIAWQDLAPDANGAGHLITSGGGTCPTTGSIVSVNCVTAATNGAGADNLALIYMPISQSITVDMSKLSGSSVTARWYDPTTGSFTTVSGSPFSLASHTLSAPGNNNAGDSDWVLLLQSS
jgi:hypothetical protein